MSRKITKIGFGGVSFVPYLETFPNCVGYFSFNRGSNAATRTQRARQGSTEQDILLSGNIQDNAQLLTLAGSSNAFTPIWYNQATANNATQTVAANQPQVVANGNLITSGGLPTARFDGNNDFLNVNGIVGSLGGNNQPFTLHFVVSCPNVTLNQVKCIFSIGDNTNGVSYLYVAILTNGNVILRKRFNTNANQAQIQSTSPLNNNQKYLISCDFDGTNGRLYIDGNLQGTINMAGNYANAFTNSRIGERQGTDHYLGDISTGALHNTSQFASGEIISAINKLKSDNAII
jgi:hypothetical protein